MTDAEVKGCVVLAMRRAGCGQEMIRQVLQALGLTKFADHSAPPDQEGAMGVEVRPIPQDAGTTAEQTAPGGGREANTANSRIFRRLVAT